MKFFGQYTELVDARAFARWLAPVRKCEWVVYAKRPFAGPQAVLASLSSYTHRVAIANSRLISLDERGITFRCKDFDAVIFPIQRIMNLSNLPTDCLQAHKNNKARPCEAGLSNGFHWCRRDESNTRPSHYE